MPIRIGLDAHLRNDPHLEFAFDFARKSELDGVEAEFLKDAFQANLVGVQRDVVLLESRHDLRRADAAVEVTVFGRVGLDRDAMLRDFDSLLAKVGLVGLLDGLQLRAVLFDHPLVMVRGNGRQAVRNEIVQGVAGLHLNDVALLAQVINRLDQEQLDAAVGGAGEPLVANGYFVPLGASGRLGVRHRALGVRGTLGRDIFLG